MTCILKAITYKVLNNNIPLMHVGLFRYNPPHTPTHSRTHIHAQTHTHTHKHTHTHHTNTHTHIHTYIHTHIQTYTQTYTCTHIHEHAHAHTQNKKLKTHKQTTWILELVAILVLLIPDLSLNNAMVIVVK